MTFTAVELTRLKRDGGVLSEDAIHWLIAAYTDGVVFDYQMSAMAMAIVFNGLNAEELAAWTEAMLHSGAVFDFSDLAAPKVDKHSTGGVGDKISIPLAPLVAACGIAIPMISGRALGHTGGTLDKLESIPGFTTRLDRHQFRDILTEHGIALAGQSDTMVPADRKLYGLRDASGTVPSIPLISSSIMSKKISEGLDGLLLDVKTGSGAQIKELDDSRLLAETMVGIGAQHGVETVALITSMDQPLGNEVGNASEIRESVDVLRGDGPEDVTELTLAFGEVMLDLAGIDGGRDRLQMAIDSGKALQKFIDVTIAQGGDPSVIEDTSLLAVAEFEANIEAPIDGYVTSCDALTIGLGATHLLGSGRTQRLGGGWKWGLKQDAFDHGVGITVHAKIGDAVSRGDPLATIRYSDESLWEAHRKELATAWIIGEEKTSPRPLILETVTSDSLDL